MGFDGRTTQYADWRAIARRRENAYCTISLTRNIAPTSYCEKVNNYISPVKQIYLRAEKRPASCWPGNYRIEL